MTTSAIRVVVVDDSATSRTLLVELCRSDPAVRVVGEGRTGRDAVELVRSLRPSVVVMDIEMPVMDGFEATKAIMAEVPTPIIIVTAKYDTRDVEVSLRAVQAGALTVLPKPAGPSSPNFPREARRFVSLVKGLSDVKAVRRRMAGPRPTRPRPVPPTVADHVPVRAVAVAASTGGPAALYRFLQMLPPALGVPILVVQHIADGFVPGLVSWLRSASTHPVKVAEHGEPLVPSTVYLAPGGRHLQATAAGTVALSDGPPVAGFRPSGSVLLSSMARAFGRASAGVVLTGMGDDGLEGARVMRAAGGVVLVQDADTAAVFGMPKAVADAGLASAVGPVEELARMVGKLATA